MFAIRNWGKCRLRNGICQWINFVVLSKDMNVARIISYVLSFARVSTVDDHLAELRFFSFERSCFPFQERLRSVDILKSTLNDSCSRSPMRPPHFDQPGNRRRSLRFPGLSPCARMLARREGNENRA